ncbi:hypothetical protein KI387_020880, partial [Taxus chinensis]
MTQCHKSETTVQVECKAPKYTRDGPGGIASIGSRDKGHIDKDRCERDLSERWMYWIVRRLTVSRLMMSTKGIDMPILPLGQGLDLYDAEWNNSFDVKHRGGQIIERDDRTKVALSEYEAMNLRRYVGNQQAEFGKFPGDF